MSTDGFVETVTILAKLLVVTDYDVGFQLMPAIIPLPEVAPGDTYVTECQPHQTVVIHEVVTDPFAITHISVGASDVQTTIEQHGSQRIYHLAAPLVAGPRDWIRMQLTNDTDVSHKQKIAVLVKLKACRPEDAAPCPACDKLPGDPCDGAFSHSARRDFYREHQRLALVTAPEQTAREHDVLVEVENRCGFCGEIFKMSPLDPHAMLIDQTTKNFGRGPICPKERL